MPFTLFTENDLTRVIKYLEINPQTSQGEEYVRGQMERTEDEFPYLVPTIQADLDTLDTLDGNLTTENLTSNSALIKADVLEWSDRAGARTQGIKGEMDRLCQRVAQLLGLEYGANSYDRVGMLMRG